jgi:hypothetical protein
MASTATNILRLEKQANGENDTTWGTKLNNLVDMVESAIAGVAAISLSNVDVTLTNVDFVDDQAKKNVLYLSGTLSGNVNIIVPNKTKTYRVINNTSGAFTVGIKTSGGSAITVTQGAAAEVWCDGSDVMRFVAAMTVIGTGAPASLTGAAASSVAVTPDGNLAATNAQAAFAELQLDVDGRQPVAAHLTAISALAATKGNLIVMNGTTPIALAAGTNGYVLMADSAQASGQKWASVMPATTPILVQQTAAPTGYTKQTTHNNKALRVVSGTASSGGSVDFTTAFASKTPTGTIGTTAISTLQLAPHLHGYFYKQGPGVAETGSSRQVAETTQNDSTGVTGQGDSHTHAFTGDAINLAVAYVDLIICTKDA